jgi:hypothetical protein
MTRILDYIAGSLRNRFHPASPDEYFALRLAARLREPEAAAHYAVLASQHPQGKLVFAFHRATDCEKPGVTPGQLFHKYLSGGNGCESLPRPRLVAFRAERRTIAVAVFTGTHLEGRRVRQLSSNPRRAESSAVGFVRAVLAEADCTSAAIETAPAQEDILRSSLHRAIVAEVRTAGISLWEISKNTLLSAFSHPRLKSRRELRDAVLSIWPLPDLKQSETCALDAFALGLFVQTERLFNNF